MNPEQLEIADVIDDSDSLRIAIARLKRQRIGSQQQHATLSHALDTIDQTLAAMQEAAGDCR